MQADVLYPTLAALAFALALNLKLTLSVLRTVRRGAHATTALQPGQTLPDVDASALTDRRPIPLGTPGQARALLFLSSRCPKCRAKVAGIDALAGAAHGAGLALWIVSDEPVWRVRALLRGSALNAYTVRVGASAYRRLNPTRASPAYLFVNHEGVVEAAGLIGDTHWRDLEQQLAPDADRERAA